MQTKGFVPRADASLADVIGRAYVPFHGPSRRDSIPLSSM